MMKATLIHLLALAGGVAIIVCLTITARTFREKEKSTVTVSSGLKCYDCFDEFCTDSRVIDCPGSCVRVEASKGPHEQTFTFQFCHQDVIEIDECEVNSTVRYNDEYLPAKTCLHCISDLCNKSNSSSKLVKKSVK